MHKVLRAVHRLECKLDAAVVRSDSSSPSHREPWVTPLHASNKEQFK
jgi:hypothetical protein